MTNFKGTKRPWYAIEYVGKFVIQTGGFYSGSDDVLECDDYPREEVEANALLISKAPEMLEMLETLVSAFDENHESQPMHELWIEAKKLIKEATTL